MATDPLKVGVTGGIGSGKSVVCRIFGLLGVPIYDADTRAKMIMNADPIVRDGIIDLFGENSYLNGVINRPYLAQKVFNDTDNIALLNAIVHPSVASDFETWVGQQDAKYVIKEAALLIESHSYEDLDILVSVVASVELRIARVLARDPQRTRAEIEGIIAKQTTEAHRQSVSQRLIHNQEEQLLIPQVLALHQKFMSQEPKS